jgi:hypothetical protein
MKTTPKEQNLRFKWGIAKWRIWVEETLEKLFFSMVEIGEITYEDLNQEDLEVKQIDVVFTNKKPVNKELVGLYFKNTQGFTTDVYGEYHEYSGDNSITGVSLKTVQDISEGNFIPEKKLGNITVSVSLENENGQNWLQGNITVYAKLRDYPL